MKNRETIAVIKGLVSAYAALKDAAETPSEFFTTKILLRISMQIMVILQARTRDPIAIFKRIYDREVAAQTYLKEKDPYIIHAARVDEHFGFPITTLLCPSLNYAHYLLKGGVIRRAIAKSIIAAHLDATIHDEHERTRQRIKETERRIESWKDGLLALLNPVVSFIKWVMPRFKSRERSGEITQEQVARDFGVSSSTVNRWEVNQTASGPENKSNKYGYYKELRTNPDLRGAYYELVNCVKRYQAEKRKADKLGIRFVTFVRFHEEWLTHQPDKMRHLRIG
ncbi:MAG: helix-turn-helix transcriptional regulator [bacterium]|nr:helix-turn-helix transcriptional regulator [bacterium]